MKKIGFIGLGRMGRPMALNLIKHGFELTVFDIDQNAVNILVDEGAESVRSVAEIVKHSEIVITMLPNPQTVLDVLIGSNGVLSQASEGFSVMDMSTVDPKTTDKIANFCSKKKISFIDAPVGRLASHADKGESLFMVGATKIDFDRVKPLLNSMGTTIYHCGPCGSGTRTKIVNNFLAVASCQMNAEALTLMKQLDLDLDTTLDVLYGTTGFNGQLKLNWSSKVLKNDIEPGFKIDLGHKDLSLVLETANDFNVPMPMAAAAREAFSSARARGFGEKDFSAMLDAQCDLVNTKPPRLSHNSRHIT